MQENSIARLCVLRSGVRPLDFFYASFRYEGELILDRRRLRSLVFGYGYENHDQLIDFLLTAPYLERLEIIVPEECVLLPLPSEVASPRLASESWSSRILSPGQTTGSDP